MISTKDQEKEALKKIKEIVAGLGEGSYVAAAFEGCFEIAEDNIGNDFSRSMKQIADSAREDLEMVYKENRKLERKVQDQAKVLTEFNEERERLNKENKAANERINDLLKERKDILYESAENAQKFDLAKEKNEALKAEIIQLKAKLYDHIIKEQEV